MGDRIQADSGPGIVKSGSGASGRCAAHPNKPIRALLIPAEGFLLPVAKTAGAKALTPLRL